MPKKPTVITDDDVSQATGQLVTVTALADVVALPWGLDAMVDAAETWWRAQPDSTDRPQQSLPWYRRRILRRIAWLRRAVRDGIRADGLEEVIIEAMELSADLTDARWRFGFGPELVRALRVRTGSRNGGPVRGAQKTREASVNDPSIKKHYAAYRQSENLQDQFASPVTYIAKKTKISRSTIERRLDKVAPGWQRRSRQ